MSLLIENFHHNKTCNLVSYSHRERYRIDGVKPHCKSKQFTHFAITLNLNKNTAIKGESFLLQLPSEHISMISSNFNRINKDKLQSL